MPKTYPPLNLKPNQKGVYVGTCGDLTRVAAHTYTAPSGTRPEVTHKVFVARITPKKSVYRCNCESYLFFGKCKHGKVALEVERTYAAQYPKQWEAETQPKPAPQIKPYVGGVKEMQ
jgi:hypothetical protein